MTKKLRRSRTNRILAGVLGGIGEYFETDPVLIRLIYLVITVFTGFVPGIITYLFAIVIVPEEPAFTPSTPTSDDDPTEA